MTCCNNTKRDKTSTPSHHLCPINGKRYPSVMNKTVLHHLKQPWLYAYSGQNHFFCDDPACDAVYFTDQEQIIDQAALRTQIGQKTLTEERTLCYCFGVNALQQRLTPSIKQFVIQQTKAKLCACDISNPSGRCCLKDFPHENKHE